MRAGRNAPGITQAALAKRLGVSQYTVSSALNGSGRVADELRERIRRTADRQGYRPHQGARALRSGSFQRVVLVQADAPQVSWLPTPLLYALHHALERRGASLEVAIMPQRAFGEAATLPRILNEYGADGLLLNYQAEPPPALMASLTHQRVPVVWLNQPQDGDCVRPDDVQAGALLAGHLLGLGHRRILYLDFHIANERDAHISRCERRAGVRSAFTGSRCSLVECCPGPIGENLIDFCARTIRDSRASGLIGYGAHEAIAMAVATQRLGWSVPRDISLATVAYNTVLPGIPIAYACSPFDAMAEAGAELLVARQVQSRHPPRRVTVPYSLMDGDACRPPTES